jgi:hypothetical protein
MPVCCNVELGGDVPTPRNPRPPRKLPNQRRPAVEATSDNPTARERSPPARTCQPALVTPTRARKPPAPTTRPTPRVFEPGARGIPDRQSLSACDELRPPWSRHHPPTTMAAGRHDIVGSPNNARGISSSARALSHRDTITTFQNGTTTTSQAAAVQLSSPRRLPPRRCWPPRPPCGAYTPCGLPARSHPSATLTGTKPTSPW